MNLIQHIILVVCFILGELLKLIFKEKLNREWLPFIMGAVGMLLCPLLCKEFSVANVATGLISGFASSGGYDALKAVKSKMKDIQ